jgi:hypothetical protein
MGSSMSVVGLAGEDRAGLQWCNGTMVTGWSQLQRTVTQRQEKGKEKRDKSGLGRQWKTGKREVGHGHAQGEGCGPHGRN